MKRQLSRWFGVLMAGSMLVHSSHGNPAEAAAQAAEEREAEAALENEAKTEILEETDHGDSH